MIFKHPKGPLTNKPQNTSNTTSPTIYYKLLHQNHSEIAALSAGIGCLL